MKGYSRLLTAGALVLGTVVSGIGSATAATCYGYSDCRACKNCKYCGHCAKRGGSCGICARHHMKNKAAAQTVKTQRRKTICHTQKKPTPAQRIVRAGR